jgi:hypothetical protein
MIGSSNLQVYILPPETSRILETGKRRDLQRPLKVDLSPCPTLNLPAWQDL